MSNYDPVRVFSVGADSNGASNGIINATTNRTGVLVHKVALVVEAGLGSNTLAVAINDHANIGSSATLISLTTGTSGSAIAEDEYERYKEACFDPPVRFGNGLSFNFTGLALGVNAYVYYTRL